MKKIKIDFRWPKSIQTRMLSFFLLLFILILGFIILPWMLFMQHAAQKDLMDLTKQQLVGLDVSISMMLENRNTVVNMMMINRQFEKQVVQESSDLSKKRALMDTLTRILVNDLDLISAAYFTDDGEVALMASSKHTYQIHQEALFTDLWEERLVKAQNDMTYFYNSGGVLEMTAYKEPFISFVRSITSIRDFDKLGVVMLNMTSKRLGEIIFSQMGESQSQVYLCENNGTVIAKTPNALENIENLDLYLKNSKNVWITKQKSNQNVICKQKSQMNGLTYISITPLNNTINTEKNYPLLGVFTVLLVAFIIFVSQFYMNKIITKPLTQICEYMHLVEMGQFVSIPIANRKAKDEITQLQLFFERMVKAIDALVIKVAEKEKLKRKHEVCLLQEQIKPHFLYNALDAISALLLIEENQTAYTLTQALGAFYRTSLSGGYEMVTVKQEINCIKNYITVLNIRYENKINVSYDISSEVEEIKILKLILQPLIENAVYHGIRNKKGSGNIWIKGILDNMSVILTVEDDGAGMTQERLEEIMTKRSHEMEKGFGIYSLIEKLDLFYDQKNLLKIESVLDQGTKVTLRLPIINKVQEEGRCKYD